MREKSHLDIWVQAVSEFNQYKLILQFHIHVQKYMLLVSHSIK